MLQQMCRGLEIYGLHEMVKQNQPLFQPLFVPAHFTKPDADFLMMALSPVLSAVGSVKQQRESRIVNYLQDFIQSLEDEEKKGAAVRRAGLKMTANRWIKQTALKEMQNKTRSPSAVSCSGLLVRGMSPLLLHKEKKII
ncbi:hypothetical protein cypCar_00044867 [Cyprinus carpio]|nr:hypothetical protein cypCar_00044867 [Cyprinus carpio]